REERPTAASFLHLSGCAAKALPHYFLEGEPRRHEGTAAAHAIPRRAPRRLRLAALAERARLLEHRAPEPHHRDVGGCEVFPRPVGDQALAVLRQRVMLGDAAHSGERAVLLLLAVEEIVVGAVAQRHVARPELGELAVAALLEARALLLGERPLGMPGVGVDPARFVVDRHPGVALQDLP